MFGSEKKPKQRARFIVTHEQRLEKTLGLGALQILVDTETGVNYINTVGEGYSGISSTQTAESSYRTPRSTKRRNKLTISALTRDCIYIYINLKEDF